MARRTLLSVHPHPDDESIACGGVLALAAASGDRTVVVTCTGGEEGENLAGIDLAGEDLATHRRRELAAALGVLGVEAHHWLGFRDSGMAGSPANDHPDAFFRADRDEAAARLAVVIRRERPLVVVSDPVDGTYGHPDHVTAYEVTRRAVEFAADARKLPGEPWRVPKRYVRVLSHRRLGAMHAALLAAGLASPFGTASSSPEALGFGVPDEQVTTRVDVRAVQEIRRRAMASHRSQIGPDSFFLNLPQALAVGVFDVEEFVLEDRPAGTAPAGDAASAKPEVDLFAGLDGLERVPPPGTTRDAR